MPRYPSEIEHSEKYYDDEFEYKHVTLTEEAAKMVRRGHLVQPKDYCKLGLMQTPGWIHYFSIPHEKHVLYFRRRRKDI